MQVNTKRVSTEKAFEPFTLTITIENRKEAEIFHNIFNHAGVCNYMVNHAGLNGSDIREAVERAGKVTITNWPEFLNYIDGKPEGE